MSGKTAGVQVKIREEYPNAVFTHCYAHQLNLKWHRQLMLSKYFLATSLPFLSFFQCRLKERLS